MKENRLIYLSDQCETSKTESAFSSRSKIEIDKKLDDILKSINTEQDLRDKIKNWSIEKNMLRSAISRQNWIIDFSIIQDRCNNINFEKTIRLSDILEIKDNKYWYIYKKWEIFEISEINSKWETFWYKVDEKWDRLKPISKTKLFLNNLDILVGDKWKLNAPETKKSFVESRTLELLFDTEKELKKKAEKNKNNPSRENIDWFFSWENPWINTINSIDNFSTEVWDWGLIEAVDRLISWKNLSNESKQKIRESWVDKNTVRYFQAVLRNYLINQAIDKLHKWNRTIDKIPWWTKVSIFDWKLQIISKEDIKIRNDREKKYKEIISLIDKRNLSNEDKKDWINKNIEWLVSEYIDKIMSWIEHNDLWKKDYENIKSLISKYPETKNVIIDILNKKWKWQTKNHNLWIKLWLIENN